MTANQLKYWDLQRQKRADAVRQFEAQESAKTQATTRALNEASAEAKKNEAILNLIRTEGVKLDNFTKEFEAWKQHKKFIDDQKTNKKGDMTVADYEIVFEEISKLVEPLGKFIGGVAKLI